MIRDEKSFPEPEDFRPERYETKSDSKERMAAGYGQDNPSVIVFGFGRRYVRDHLNPTVLETGQCR